MNDLVMSAAVETEWARALYQVLLRMETTPIHDALAAEHGHNDD